MSESTTKLANAIWLTILNHYKQEGRQKVEYPYNEALFVLCSIMANVIATVDAPHERTKILQTIAPQTAMLLDKIRGKPTIRIPSTPHLILPN